MSNDQNSTHGLPPPAPRSTGGQVALLLFGGLFLLPGGCALVVMLGFLAEFLQRGRTDPFIGPLSVLWLICLAISALGIFMIRAARSKTRSPS
jgi:hypothetical protein